MQSELSVQPYAGGDSGIGRSVAVHFARERADVCISYLDEHDDAKVRTGIVATCLYNSSQQACQSNMQSCRMRHPGYLQLCKFDDLSPVNINHLRAESTQLLQCTLMSAF